MPHTKRCRDAKTLGKSKSVRSIQNQHLVVQSCLLDFVSVNTFHAERLRLRLNERQAWSLHETNVIAAVKWRAGSTFYRNPRGDGRKEFDLEAVRRFPLWVHELAYHQKIATNTQRGQTLVSNLSVSLPVCSLACPSARDRANQSACVFALPLSALSLRHSTGVVPHIATYILICTTLRQRSGNRRP